MIHNIETRYFSGECIDEQEFSDFLLLLLLNRGFCKCEDEALDLLQVISTKEDIGGLEDGSEVDALRSMCYMHKGTMLGNRIPVLMWHLLNCNLRIDDEGAPFFSSLFTGVLGCLGFAVTILPQEAQAVVAEHSEYWATAKTAANVNSWKDMPDGTDQYEMVVVTSLVSGSQKRFCLPTFVDGETVRDTLNMHDDVVLYHLWR
jgi:hypothetical protein